MVEAMVYIAYAVPTPRLQVLVQRSVVLVN